jgi:hypothetical protein
LPFLGWFYLFISLQLQLEVETPYLAREFLVEPADEDDGSVDDDITCFQPRSYHAFWVNILGKVNIRKRPPLKHCPHCQKLPSLKQHCRILGGLLEDYKLNTEEFSDAQPFFFGKYADSLVKAQAKLQSLGLFLSMWALTTYLRFSSRVEARQG